MTIQIRRDTAANWTSANPTLASGQPGYETDTGRLKFGDGTTAWNSLGYFDPGASAVADGSYGDIQVTGSGTVWTVVTAAVNSTKLGGDITPAGVALLVDTSAGAQRNTLGLGSAALASVSAFASVGHGHPLATTSTDGFISSTDKTKLNGIEANAQVNVSTDLSYDVSTRALNITTGSGITFPIFTTTEAGLVPAPVSSPGNFLRDDGTWASPISGSAEGRAHVVPTLSDFTWVNQGSASATQRSYGFAISATGNSTAHNWRILARAAPSTPYAIIARLRRFSFNASWHWHAIGFRDSATGRLVSHGVYSAGVTPVVRREYWTSPTTQTGASADVNWWPILEWMRIRDDGTNIYGDISVNGDDWIQMFSLGRTAHLANPDEVWVGWNMYAGTAAGQLQVLSWETA